jgi:hypothetical protein
MPDDNDERKEFDDGSKPDWRVIMGEFRTMLKTIYPSPSVTFVITKKELETHLKDRAMHYRNEAELMLSGATPIPFVVTPPRPIGASPMATAFDPDPMPAPTQVDALEMRKTIAEGYRARARRFEFMAGHLPAVESFTLSLFDFEQYELVPDPYANVGHFAAMPRR